MGCSPIRIHPLPQAHLLCEEATEMRENRLLVPSLREQCVELRETIKQVRRNDMSLTCHYM